jgi:hypothetical protein
MAETKGSRTLEMRVAELEDKLSQMHVSEEEMETYQRVAQKLGAAVPCSTSPCVAAQQQQPCIAAQQQQQPCVAAQTAQQPCIASQGPQAAIQPIMPRYYNCYYYRCYYYPIYYADCIPGCAPGGGAAGGGGGFGGFGT